MDIKNVGASAPFPGGIEIDSGCPPPNREGARVFTYLRFYYALSPISEEVKTKKGGKRV